MGTTTTVAEAQRISSREYSEMLVRYGSNSYRGYELERVAGSWLTGDHYVVMKDGVAVTEPVSAGSYSSNFFLYDSDQNGVPEAYLRVGGLLWVDYWRFDLSECR